jgi:DNA-binding MarR family transcriptional regulator
MLAYGNILAYIPIMSDSSFAAVMRLLRAHAGVADRFGKGLGFIHGLGLNEVMLLLHLERSPRGQLSRVDLAQRLSVSPSTVTRMTAPLEKIGMVGRQSNPRDARLAYVVLTAAGRKAITNARASLERMAQDVFRDRWTETEIATLASLLARLTANQPGDLA